LSASTRPLIVGILNITEDSFSDGGRYLDPAASIAQARRLVAGGADIVELGGAASNVAAKPVSPEEEIRRLDPVLAVLQAERVPISIDTFRIETQRFALGRGVEYLNDIQGFPDSALYAELAAASCRLIVMHATQSEGIAQSLDLGPEEVWQHILGFFSERIPRLGRAGIARERLILDPGMGLFLSRRAESSLRVLRGLNELKEAFGLPVLVSVSRKSFLRALTGHNDPAQLGAATLSAELYAVRHGANLIRTHDPAALRDALTVMDALDSAAGLISG
jgi:dihydropteroate synthase type 2